MVKSAGRHSTRRRSGRSTRKDASTATSSGTRRRARSCRAMSARRRRRRSRRGRSARKVGPSGPSMGGFFTRLRRAARQALADWTRPRQGRARRRRSAPPRPAGVERNLVVTLWDWGSPIDGRSDNVAGDTRIADGQRQRSDLRRRRNDRSADHARSGRTPGEEHQGPDRGAAADRRRSMPRRLVPSGARTCGSARPTSAARQSTPTASCGWPCRMRDARSSRRSARRARTCSPPTTRCAPAAGKSRSTTRRPTSYEHVDTCFNADHNMFDANNNIYFGMNGAVGWIDVNAWEKTHDAEQSQGWCPAVLDTNGDGRSRRAGPSRISRSTRPRITGSTSAATRWRSIRRTAACGAPASAGRQALMRLERGIQPADDVQGRVLRAAADEPAPPAFGSGGVEVDHHGRRVAELARERALLRVRSEQVQVDTGPKATGQSCPEGWTFYRRTIRRSNAPVPSRTRAI